MLIFGVFGLALAGCTGRGQPSAQEATSPAIEETRDERPRAERLDDKLFTPLWQVLQQADDVILGETLSTSDDGRRVEVLVLWSTKNALHETERVTIPNPRLVTEEGLVEFRPKSRFVYVLRASDAGGWHTPEFGDEAVFRVENDRVFIPAFYRPGVTLPAHSPAVAIPRKVFVSVANGCHRRDEAWCRQAIADAFRAPPP